MYLIVLRVLHIGFGVFWAGAAFTMAWLVAPTLREIGRDGEKFMEGLVVRRRLPVVLMVSAIISVLSGLALYDRNSAHFQQFYLTSGPGITYGIGGIAAILVFVIGMSVNAPAAKKLAAIGQRVKASGGPPSAEDTAEMQALQKRLALALRVTAWLLLVTLVAMAIGRYVS
jgi:hypothetical protein